MVGPDPVVKSPYSKVNKVIEKIDKMHTITANVSKQAMDRPQSLEQKMLAGKFRSKVSV